MGTTVLKAKKEYARMSPTEFRRCIERVLGWTQVETAQAFGVAVRTVQYWLNPKREEVPGPVAILTRLWCDKPELQPSFLKDKQQQ